MISSTIYVAGSEAGPKKVGITQKMERRVRSLQTASALPIAVLYAREVPADLASQVEGHAHWLLRERRRHGEWFDITFDQAKEAVDAAVACRGDGEQAKRNVGRRQINHEQMPARFAEGTLARIDTVLAGKEKRSDFIRDAVERELARRAKLKPGKGAAEGSE